MPLPVDPTYTALGHKINDVDRYPHDDDRPPEPPERPFGQAAQPLDPKVHTWARFQVIFIIIFLFCLFYFVLISVLNCAWNREWEGLNHVLWEAAGDNNVPLVKVFFLFLLHLTESLPHVLWEVLGTTYPPNQGNFIYLFIYFYF